MAMRRWKRGALLASVLALHFAWPPGHAAGQTTRAAHGSVSELLAMWRSAAGSGPLDLVLSQRHREYSTSFLDELADSLAAIAIAGRPDQATPVTANLPGMALSTLKLSHVGHDARIPYAGAFDRLRRVYVEAGDPLIRIAALRHMIAVGGGGRGLAYAREFFTSDDPNVWLALGSIMMDASAGVLPALALVRQLYEEDLLRDPVARSLLEGYAHGKGWRQPRRD
jgi:hypothetical protein